MVPRTRIAAACRRPLCAAVAAALVASSLSAQSRQPYVETFDRGPGGWVAVKVGKVNVEGRAPVVKSTGAEPVPSLNTCRIW